MCSAHSFICRKAEIVILKRSASLPVRVINVTWTKEIFPNPNIDRAVQALYLRFHKSMFSQISGLSLLTCTFPLVITFNDSNKKMMEMSTERRFRHRVAQICVVFFVPVFLVSLGLAVGRKALLLEIVMRTVSKGFSTNSWSTSTGHPLRILCNVHELRRLCQRDAL